MFDVIVCGSLHLDIMLHAPHLPRRDETVPGHRWGQQAGGKGGNQVVMAARAGARTAMIGRVGDDDFGRHLRAHLDAAGVDASCVGVDAAAGSGMSAAIVQDDGDYGAVIVSGANLNIEPARLAAIWRGLGGARVAVLQNEIPEAANIAAARAARDGGAKVILNAAPARSMTADLLDRVDVLVVNRIEAAMLSGCDDPLAALPRLAAPGRAAIVTLGGEGLVLQEAGAEPLFIAPHKVSVVSTHGAGDCFVGALAARLSRGEALYGAAEAANFAAARHVAALAWGADMT